MAILVLGCCFLTYYCGAVLKTSIISTYVYYIPIILASLWWKRKGLLVTFFLIAAWFLSRTMFRSALFGTDDFLQVTMFLFVGILTALVSEKIEKIADKLYRANIYLENLFNYASVPIIVWNSDFEITRFNHAFERLTGKTVKDVLGCPIEILFPDDRCDEAMIQIHHTMDGERWESVEIPILGADGTIRTVLWNSATLYSNDSKTVVATIAQGQDVTERLRAQRQVLRHQAELAHVSRVNTVGEMSSSLAHELNQPLCAILNYTSACVRLMKAENISTGKVEGALDQIAAEAYRAGEIIRRIRNLVNKRQPKQSKVDINDVVQGVINMEESELIQNNICVKTELAENLPLIYVDQVQIEQVVLNLVRNAVEAMSDTTIGQRQLTVKALTNEADVVEVAVCDTGKGLLTENTEEIFDSFFTTKSFGLGIGLSISRSIITAHGGRLWAEPNPAGGAIFRFTLPSEGAKHGKL